MNRCLITKTFPLIAANYDNELQFLRLDMKILSPNPFDSELIGGSLG
jgi:hypothetical protein